jgi:hypothetical protein
MPKQVAAFPAHDATVESSAKILTGQRKTPKRGVAELDSKSRDCPQPEDLWNRARRTFGIAETPSSAT